MRAKSMTARPGSDAAPSALCSAALHAALIGERGVMKGFLTVIIKTIQI